MANMNWTKWSVDNLPKAGEKVLIAYKSGLVGAIDFFSTEGQREMYISGMKMCDENFDPIIAWMPCPKAPEW